MNVIAFHPSAEIFHVSFLDKHASNALVADFAYAPPAMLKPYGNALPRTAALGASAAKIRKKAESAKLPAENLIIMCSFSASKAVAGWESACSTQGGPKALRIIIQFTTGTQVSHLRQPQVRHLRTSSRLQR